MVESRSLGPYLVSVLGEVAFGLEYGEGIMHIKTKKGLQLGEDIFSFIFSEPRFCIPMTSRCVLFPGFNLVRVLCDEYKPLRIRAPYCS